MLTDERYACRVLVLDDEPFMLKLLSQLLGRLGFLQVDTMENGAQALHRLINAETAPHLILLDLNMPGMDGIEFLRKLGDQGFSGAVILVSGEDERILSTVEALAKGQSFTLLGHLQKPVTRQMLEELIERWTPEALIEENRKNSNTYEAEALQIAIHRGEFVNFYQPKVLMSTGELVGVEALIRWRHPNDGLVYPDQFIATAENEGLIDALLLAVLRAAMADIKTWKAQGLALRVAVNVSMDSLNALDFPDRVLRLADEEGVASYDLMLEVTESRLMQDIRAVLDILSRLRLKRFDLAIDDFGTGHSSLMQLRDLPFTQLKIDQGFVRGAHKDRTKQAICTGSLNMAKELGMEIVAEGVETRDDWDYLKRTKCDMAQGYFIAKPMPADALPGWAEVWRQRVNSNFTGEGPAGARSSYP